MSQMTEDSKVLIGVLIIGVVLVGVLIGTNSFHAPSQDELNPQFPDFITKTEEYFITRIKDVPRIDRDIYRLNVRGLIDNPRFFTLEELHELDMVELPLTVECIGNSENGRLVGTALWKGFLVYNLIESLGIQDGATGVKFNAADDYYVSYTMDQLRNNGILGALYMNGEEIPPIQGFPLRIVNPGYYGAKHPMWVIDIKVIDGPLEDFYEDLGVGWDTTPPMEIDSKIFFPRRMTSINVSESLAVGGCAFGGTRVKLVEYTTDDGKLWNNASIVKQIDADNVWVFWEIEVSLPTPGPITLQIRATDIYGNQQPRNDTSFLNGTSSWPFIIISVESN